MAYPNGGRRLPRRDLEVQRPSACCGGLRAGVRRPDIGALHFEVAGGRCQPLQSSDRGQRTGAPEHAALGGARQARAELPTSARCPQPDLPVSRQAGSGLLILLRRRRTVCGEVKWKEDSVRSEDSPSTRPRGRLGRIVERRKLKRQRKLERKARQQEHERENLSGSGQPAP